MDIRHWVTALALTLALAGTALAEKRPLRFEDLFGMKRVSDVQVSPDGTWAAYVQAEYSIDKNSSTKDIWLVSLRDGKTRRLTTSPASDWSPRWMPGSHDLAFLSTRGGNAQVWSISIDGGEATPLTGVYGGIDEFVLSSDGKSLLFVSEVWPNCPTEEANKKCDEARASEKCTGKILDRLFFRSWNRWVDEKYSHLFLFDLATGRSRELTAGKLRVPPLDLATGSSFCCSPDGTELLYVANATDQPALNTNNDVFRLRLSGGEAENLTRENHANDCGVSYSPDGRYMAWLAMSRPGFEADKLNLVVTERATGMRRVITSNWDRSVDQYTWAPDGKTIYMVTEDRGHSAIFSVPTEGGEVKPLSRGAWNTEVRVTPDGKSLVFLQQASNLPSDVWKMDLASGLTNQLTRVNEERLAQIEMNPIEEFWFDGAKGDKVQGLFVRPPHFEKGKKYPVVFLIHGGPQGMFGDDFHYRWNSQMFAAPGWIAVMINFHGSKGYGQKFTDAVSRDWGGAPYQDIQKGVDYFLANYDFADRDRIAAAGASYGGYMINWISTQTQRFRCLVSHDGVFDLRSMHGSTEEVWFPEWEYGGAPWQAGTDYEKFSPINFAGNIKTPMLVVHSELDYRVPVSQGFQLFTTLQRQGVESKLLYFPDEDHFVSKPQNARLWWATVTEWISSHLK